jgi:hypothetical protein
MHCSIAHPESITLNTSIISKSFNLNNYGHDTLIFINYLRVKNSMIKIFGNFITEIPTQTEYLQIGFSPSSIPLQQRWQTNGLSADFISEYLDVFFVGQQTLHGEKIVISSEINDAVKYVANELLENAMKFSTVDADIPTRISFFLLDQQVIFQVVNAITRERADEFEILIHTLLDNDPRELYISQMEANAEDTNEHSGLGFLSMICDYTAKLGWKFEIPTPNSPHAIITTMVSLEVI